MSVENVELVRRLYAAYDDGDLDAAFALLDAQIEWHVGEIPGFDDLNPLYVGHAGVRDFFRTWLEAWETISFEYEEFIDAGDEVVASLSQRTRGRASGVELELSSYAQLWTVCAGKLTRVQFFLSRQDAFRALQSPT
jgi:ketosteroid isomerase-like protein